MPDDYPLSLAPGEHRCPGPSTRDIILADGCDVPPGLIAESYQFGGDADLDYDRYISPAFFEQEIRHLWPKVWQWACREEQIPEVGDYITYDVGPYSFLIVRSAPTEIRAYYNACLHRGTQLRPSESQGSTPDLRCPFHGWTWSLQGELQKLPCRWDFPHVSDAKYRLPEIKIACWGGFVFINMDPEAKPLADHLGVLTEHFKDTWDLKNRYVALHIQKELPTNWKAAQEAFLEAYHVLETHSQTLATAGDANAQYDIFGETVTRFVHTLGFPSPHYEKPITQQEILDKMGFAPVDAVVGEGQTARSVAAGALRKSLGSQWDVDLSSYSDSEMLDSIEYHLFPNMFLFPGVSLPMIYRFRPIGMDPGRTIFDLLFLRPLAPGMAPPEPPNPVHVGVRESYADVPGMNKHLGFVFDQDTGNLEMQYRGFFASKKRGETLGNYQEARIRHYNSVIDRYLAAGAS